MSEVEVLVVTARRLADDDNGGGVRTARLVEVLADRYRTAVAQPADPGVAPSGLRFPPSALDLHLALSPAATEGASLWRGAESAVDAMTATRAPVVFWADAVLASAGLGRVLPEAVQVVEFANLETRRYLGSAMEGSPKRRAYSVWEAAKAAAWQRSVARRADAVVALSAADARGLTTRSPKLLVRNGVEPIAGTVPSRGSTVLAVGSWWYAPNRHGLRRFLRHDWPRIRHERPDARLRIVGAGGDALVGDPPPGVEVAGFVPDLDPLYADAAVVLAPARSGGGSQLKLVGALAHRRIVAGPRFLARERTPGLPEGAFEAHADVARAVLRLLGDDERRHRTESRIADWVGSHSWRRTAEPLTRFIDRALGRTQAA